MASKILVVDDEVDLEELIKQKFRKQIRNGVYEFVFATNGIKALEVLQAEKDIDMVLTDINMPEMDGLTLLGKLRDDFDSLSAVIVSAYGDMENIRTAMNRGAFDFITKPIDFRDLELTMDKTIQHVSERRQSQLTMEENSLLRKYVNEIEKQKTQIQAQNETLKELNDEIFQQKKLKDRFFAIISHDLRGPVSSFKGICDIITMYVQNEQFVKLTEMMEEVDQATEQLSRLLDNLLNWASQEMSQIPYNPVSIDIWDMVTDIFDTLHSSATSKSVELHNSVTKGAKVWADLNSTFTIFRNLIHNALKFTEAGGSIEVKTEVKGDKVEVHVKDTGVGMSPEQVQKLFKLPSSTYGTGGEKGVGLGMQLVSEFTKLNNGHVEVESVPGSGSTFKISLPVAPTP